MTMTTDSPAFVIGSSAADHLSLRPLRRAHPQCRDHWDGNWLTVDVAVRTGAFHGRFEADLRTDEFVGFRDQLRALHQSLKGAADFRALEQWVSIRVVGDGLGHLEAQCELMDEPGIGSRLEFVIRFDQTYVPPMLEALDAIATAFPVIGASDT